MYLFQKRHRTREVGTTFVIDSINSNSIVVRYMCTPCKLSELPVFLQNQGANNSCTENNILGYDIPLMGVTELWRSWPRALQGVTFIFLNERWQHSLREEEEEEAGERHLVSVWHPPSLPPRVNHHQSGWRLCDLAWWSLLIQKSLRGSASLQLSSQLWAQQRLSADIRSGRDAACTTLCCGAIHDAKLINICFQNDTVWCMAALHM